jgi:hypothetical protein
MTGWKEIMQMGPGTISQALFYDKTVSDNLRHSHDAEIHDQRADGSTWLLQKTFTLDEGVKGTLRFKFDYKGETSGNANNRVVWAKNSKANDLGAEEHSPTTSWATKSQDNSVGTMEANETIELWTKCNDWQGIFVRNARLYYDNDNLPIAVGMTTS